MRKLSKYVEAKAKLSEFKVILYGKQLQMNDFEFNLINKSNGATVQTQKNSANGSISFSDLTFDAVGTYSYKVKQKIPLARNERYVPYMTYDNREIDLKIVVGLNGTGNFAVSTVTYSYNGTNIAPEFQNRYQVKGKIW